MKIKRDCLEEGLSRHVACYVQDQLGMQGLPGRRFTFNSSWNSQLPSEIKRDCLEGDFGSMIAQKRKAVLFSPPILNKISNQNLKLV